MPRLHRLGSWLLGALAGLALGWAALPARAQTGMADPAFQAALAAWLADDEAGALPALAELARLGHPDARLLLGLIDKTPALQGPWLAQRTRAERIAVLRAEGAGRSGQSWLYLDRDQPLADAWRRLMDVAAGPDVVADLTAMGEARAAREATVTLAGRDPAGLAALWDQGVDPELAYLFWAHGDADLRARIAARVPPDHPQWALMGLPSPQPTTAWAGWLADNPAAAPLAALCAAACPDSAAACRSAAYDALHSHSALLTLGSPVESLVDQATFLSSARGRAATLRRILLATDARGRAGQIARARATDACLATLLEQEAARYRPARASPLR